MGVSGFVHGTKKNASMTLSSSIQLHETKAISFRFENKRAWRCFGRRGKRPSGGFSIQPGNKVSLSPFSDHHRNADVLAPLSGALILFGFCKRLQLIRRRSEPWNSNLSHSFPYTLSSARRIGIRSSHLRAIHLSHLITAGAFANRIAYSYRQGRNMRKHSFVCRAEEFPETHSSVL